MRWRDVRIRRFYELSLSLTGSYWRWKILTWPAPHPAGSLSKSGLAAVVEPGAGERGRPRTGPLPLLLLCKLKTRSVPLRLSRPAPGLPSDSQFGKQAISHIVHPLLVCWCVPWISVCLLLTHTWPDTNLMESETNHSTERSNLNPQNSNWFRPELLGSHNPRFLLLLG